MTEKVRPWDLFIGNKPKLSADLAAKRFDVCKSCEHFIALTGQCKKCGCFMAVKTKLENATCPVGKW